MKVYIVTTHWHYDSTDIDGVYFSESEANKKYEELRET